MMFDILVVWKDKKRNEERSTGSSLTVERLVDSMLGKWHLVRYMKVTPKETARAKRKPLKIRCEHVKSYHPIHPTEGWSNTTILECADCGATQDLSSTDRKWKPKVEK
jgi:hypothetical protein